MRDSFEFIHDNKIIFEEAKRKTLCSHCNEKIFKKDLVCMNAQTPQLQKYKYHLHCFRPIFDTPITDNMVLIMIQEKTNKEKISIWLKKWNRLLRNKDPNVRDYNISIEKKLKIEGKRDSLLSKLTPQSLVHILSFLSFEEIIFIVKFIDKSLYELTWNPMLWKSLCFRDFASDIITPYKNEGLSLHPRSDDWISIYAKLRRISCYVCKTFNSPNIKQCPIEKKPICQKCRVSEDFELIRLLEIKHQYGVTLWKIFEDHVEKYAITYEGEKVFYKRDVENAYKAYLHYLYRTRSCK
jgi:hypothetical protein